MTHVSTLLTPRAAVHQLDPHNLAIQWMFRHGHSLGRVAAIEGLTAYLMEATGVSQRSAEVQAIQAYAETSSVSQLAHIDADATTAHVVVLRTLTGRAVAFTTDDLLHLLEQARDQGKARVVNAQPAALAQ
ncbi:MULTISPECIES: hypothetical protein [unclassified Halomonas]|uniref:hypothetical protein n=1 Tax=unclassified Halomonas TaxID=2609666 RepID=UPI002883DFB8|nr:MULTISPECIES: hypothetical protein [unclassified Halomonas]MDT0501615.1 hypothetical protein [Halomonas sp. PAR7]MDT0511028.1 hypothetical protein [Halomonas sp. LES1]MDT0592455.1 hypothetical protein [Halomonas sp. PAR8]